MKQTRGTQLVLTSSPEEAWKEVISPWFEAVSPAGWRDPLPSVAVVPTRGHVHALKTKLLEQDWSNLGLHFVTPSGLPTLLAGADTRLGEWPHFGLLLAIAAEQVSGDEPSTRAVLRSPEALLRTLDRIAACGWRFDELRYPALEPVVARFDELLNACGFALPATIHRQLAHDARHEPPRFSNLLIAGFDGAHWPLWSLLQAAVRAAQETTVVLQHPRDAARELDEAWIGTWEENYGAAEFGTRPSITGETLFPELFEPELFDRATEARAITKHFIVGRGVTEQANAIVALTESFLCSSPEPATAATALPRIGVLFPAAGALPRIVATLLCEARIPHFDGVARRTPGPLEDEAWPRWMELQEKPRVRVLLDFLRLCPAARHLFGGLHLDEIEDVLGRATQNLMLDDVEVLRRYCATENEKSQHVAGGLAAIRLLPQRATLGDFVAETCAIFDAFGWHERRSHLQQITAAWSSNVPGAFSHLIYLRWLAQISSSLLPQREPRGDHPYSRVHLLLPAQAEGETWSHLIFAGLNEGAWPARPNESAFVDQQEIAVFNAQIRRLNRNVRRQGSQGEGHSVVAEGHTFYLGPAEQRALAERQFRALCESVTVAIGASANLVEEDAPARLANPSEFFTRLYLEARGEPPGEQLMANLAKRTGEWLQRPASARRPTDKADIRQTAIAYCARRTPETQFGEYEFALREAPPEPLVLSATDCERIIKAPALVWLRRFLGVEAREDEVANWNLAIGQWVHDWLRQVAPSDGVFVPRPRATDVRDRVRRAALRFREETAQWFGRRLPDWWISSWNQAAFIADALAETLTTTEDWSHFATEWALARVAVPVSATTELRVRGRVDLVLARENGTTIRARDPRDERGEFPFREAWVIDYKTGRRPSLAPGRRATDKADDFRTKLLDGKGVQLAIYALALRALGAEGVGISLLTRELDLDGTQVDLPVIEAQREIWEAFAELSRTGVFGMRGTLRSEFGFQKNYPLATLGLDPDFLEEKWIRTHPALPKIEKR